MAIDLAIHANRCPDDELVARELDVDRQTIGRDIE
jgi:hypothetical protein